MSKNEKRVRIVQRIEDGTIFTWSPVLAEKPEFRTGTKVLVDGKQKELILDRLGPADISKIPNVGERERVLMNTVEALQERLAQYEGAQKPVSEAVTVEEEKVETPKVGPEETPLPPVPDDLTLVEEEVLPPAEDEAVIEFQPEPKMLKDWELNKLTKEGLIVHAHEVRKNVNLPDGATKAELVAICLDLQEKYKARVEDLEI